MPKLNQLMAMAILLAIKQRLHIKQRHQAKKVEKDDRKVR